MEVGVGGWLGGENCGPPHRLTAPVKLLGCHVTEAPVDHPVILRPQLRPRETEEPSSQATGLCEIIKYRLTCRVFGGLLNKTTEKSLLSLPSAPPRTFARITVTSLRSQFLCRLPWCAFPHFLDGVKCPSFLLPKNPVFPPSIYPATCPSPSNCLFIFCCSLPVRT